jgi:hypothetical protein
MQHFVHRLLVAAFVGVLLLNVEDWYHFGLANYPSKNSLRNIWSAAMSYGEEHAARDQKEMEAMEKDGRLWDYQEALRMAKKAGDHGYQAEMVNKVGVARVEEAGAEGPSAMLGLLKLGMYMFLGFTLISIIPPLFARKPTEIDKVKAFLRREMEK